MTDIKLEIALAPHPRASIIQPELHVLPMMEGDEAENLLCGKCSVVLCKGVSIAGVRDRFAAPVQLLIKCPKCGVHNKLPAQFTN